MIRIHEDREMKRLKSQAHRLLEHLFGEFYVTENRIQMYKWLRKNTRTGHIATCTKEELKYVVKRLMNVHI